MAFVSCMLQVVLLSAALQLTTSLPLWERRHAHKSLVSYFPSHHRNEDDLEGVTSSEPIYFNTQSQIARNYVGALLEAKLSQARVPGLERRRQLGDIEFSNRYAEYLRSKAKHSSICAFLRRMQNVKKSGLGGDTERVNVLLNQYMCPSVYSWSSDSLGAGANNL